MTSVSSRSRSIDAGLCQGPESPSTAWSTPPLGPAGGDRPPTPQPATAAARQAMIAPTAQERVARLGASPAGRHIGRTATGGNPPATRPFGRADRAVHHERNRMMARTKRSRRSYGAGEWGRNRVRVFPDPKTGIFQIEWRENGRRLTRSLGHRDWVRAKRQATNSPPGSSART